MYQNIISFEYFKSVHEKKNIVEKDIQIPYTIKPCTNSARQLVSYLSYYNYHVSTTLNLKDCLIRTTTKQNKRGQNELNLVPKKQNESNE